MKIHGPKKQHETGTYSPIDNYIYFVWLLLAFFLPVSKKAIPLLIGTALVLSVISAAYRRWKGFGKPGPASAAMMLLYGLFAVGMFYTSDTGSGWFDLEVKLSFIVIPLILIFDTGSICNRARVQGVKIAFAVGAVFATVSCLAHALYVSLTTYFTFDNFEYTRLSFVFHPSYLSMYLNAVIVIIFMAMIRKWMALKPIHKVALLFTILYLFVFIIFLNSKAGIFLSFLTILVLLLYLVINRRIYVMGAVTFFLLVAVSAFVFMRTPYLKSRLVSFWEVVSGEQSIDGKSGDGTENRILIWKNAMQVGLENLPFGVGTGDVHQSLNDAYQKHNFSEGAAINLNTHNQYLQTLVAIGLPGLLLLLFICVYLVVHGIRTRNGYIVLIILILMGNFLVESMLETQAGIVFFAVIVCLYDMVERRCMVVNPGASDNVQL